MSTSWNEKTFIDYLNEVDRLLEDRFGRTTDNAELAAVAAAQESGESPDECVQSLVYTAKVRALNDQLRGRVGMPVFGPSAGRCFLTAGIAALSPEQQIIAMAKVRDFDEFTEDNDPYGEHDFGAFTLNGQKIFWKIDYYSKDMKSGSEDPADPDKTTRVLTILLAEEW